MTADARRRAEEALAEYDRLWGAAHATNAYGRAVVGLASALRALLAAGPEAPTPPSDAVGEAAERLWHSLTPPRSTTDDGMLLVRAEDVEAVLRALASFPAAPPSDAVAAPKAARPKGDIWDACGCPNPDDCEHVFYEPAPSDAAVREAAEVVRTILTAHDARLSESGALTYGPPSKGTGFVAAIQWLRRYDAARGGE